MPRTRQLKTARRVLERDELRAAQSLALNEQQLREVEARLSKLRSYRADYVREFTRRAGGGMSATSARSYQAFLARLDEALREQTELMLRAQAKRAEQLSKWRGATQRTAVLDRAVEQQCTEERRRLERHEQRESDERAQRRWTLGAHRRAR